MTLPQGTQQRYRHRSLGTAPMGELAHPGSPFVSQQEAHMAKRRPFENNSRQHQWGDRVQQEEEVRKAAAAAVLVSDLTRAYLDRRELERLLVR